MPDANSSNPLSSLTQADLDAIIEAGSVETATAELPLIVLLSNLCAGTTMFELGVTTFGAVADMFGPRTAVRSAMMWGISVGIRLEKLLQEKAGATVDTKELERMLGL